MRKAIGYLDDARESIQAAQEIVGSVKDQEEEDFDNMPECRQESEAGQKMEENIDQLDSVISELDDLAYNLEEQSGVIDEVIEK